MAKATRKAILVPPEAGLGAEKRRKAPPHQFVLDALASVSVRTRPMFGCLAVYVGEKIVLILRDKLGADPDNGVWIATTEEHHESLRRDFPGMRSIRVFGHGGYALASSSFRCDGFRGGGAAGVRVDCRARPEDRKDSERPAEVTSALAPKAFSKKQHNCHLSVASGR